MKNKFGAKVVLATIGIVLWCIAMIFMTLLTGATCLCSRVVCVLSDQHASERKTRMDEFMPIFNEINSEINGVFSVKEIKENCDYTLSYYLDFNGNREQFIPSCAEYISSFAYKVRDSVGSRRDFSVFVYCGEYYFGCERDSIRSGIGDEYKFVTVIRTDFYLDDYSVLEAIPDITECYVTIKDFTAEQREQLDSIKNNYSFKIILSE